MNSEDLPQPVSLPVNFAGVIAEQSFWFDLYKINQHSPRIQAFLKSRNVSGVYDLDYQDFVFLNRKMAETWRDPEFQEKFVRCLRLFRQAGLTYKYGEISKFVGFEHPVISKFIEKEGGISHQSMQKLIDTLEAKLAALKN